MKTLIATISTGKITAGFWVNNALLDTLREQGGTRPSDEDVVRFRVAKVDEEGMVIDTFHGNIDLKFNMQDLKHPERFSGARIPKRWNEELVKHRGLYHPVTVLVSCLEHGKFFVPHPSIN